MSATIWIVVAVVIVLVAVAVIAAVMRGSKTRKLQKQRAHAHDIRESASVHSQTVEERETEAASIEARAEKTRAEADARAREAERMESVAGEHRHRADSERAEYDEKLRRADEIDPDVPGEHTDGSRHKAGRFGSEPTAETYDERAYAEGTPADHDHFPEQRTEGESTEGTHRA